MHNKYIKNFLSIRLMLVTRTAGTNKMKWAGVGGIWLQRVRSLVGRWTNKESYKTMCYNSAIIAMCGVPRGRELWEWTSHMSIEIIAQRNFTQSHAVSNYVPKSTIIISPNCQIRASPQNLLYSGFVIFLSNKAFVKFNTFLGIFYARFKCRAANIIRFPPCLVSLSNNNQQVRTS